MAEWIVFAGDRCGDVTRVDEFREWWDKIHLPDFAETRGTCKATLYELDPQSLPEVPEEMARFVAVIEIEADNAEEINKALKDNLGPKKEKGFHELKRPSLSAKLGVYKKISSISK